MFWGNSKPILFPFSRITKVMCLSTFMALYIPVCSDIIPAGTGCDLN